MNAPPAAPQLDDTERSRLLRRLERWLEVPMLVLGLVWLVLMIVEFTQGLSPLLEWAGLAIWAIFVVDFVLKLTLAPRKLDYLASNWLTALAIAVPALRLARVFRGLRVLQMAGATRGVRLLRVVASLNRGMRSLAVGMSRRGFEYVALLTLVVVFGGSAGMYAFERDQPGGFASYGDALWWTSMVIMTMGSAYWPQSVEGRILCLLLSLYGFCVFGYLTATLATYFIGRDAKEDRAAGAGEESGLREEIAGLRSELSTLSQQLREAVSQQPSNGLTPAVPAAPSHARR